MPNQLAQSSSPYLLQHAENPVDWHPWSPEALAQSRDDDMPIFLSIGYAACHWCHVMEHESFEDQKIAAYLNQHFICIKVDREERPDLDQVYMQAIQLMTGRGGWPMSIFLTPELQPFFGGTYWPPESRMGMPGFLQILEAVVDAWTNRRTQARDQALRLTAHLQALGRETTEDRADLEQINLERIFQTLEQSFDVRHGGFGTAPKFPHSMDLMFLLRFHRTSNQAAALAMVRNNLDKMAAGGIYDHLGGGFARYSVDEKWLVPHFEKMLYDNALLASVYLEAYQVTSEPNYARVVRETLDYVLEEMTDPEGGFYSTEDADSEGVEGKFYVWSLGEIQETLGSERAAEFARVYDVTAAGNFEGANILNLPRSLADWASDWGRDPAELQAQLEHDRSVLKQRRAARVRPGKDDKVLASWNGLMLEALARAAAHLDHARYRDAATRAAEFLTGPMRREDGRLWHCWRHGKPSVGGFLDDHACVGNGLWALYEATFDERWLEHACQMAERCLEHFSDPDGRGFFYTAHDHEPLIARQKEFHDSSVPASNAALATLLIRLGRLCGNSSWLSAAEDILRAAQGRLERSPAMSGQMAVAIDLFRQPGAEIVLVGNPAEPIVQRTLRALHTAFRPHTVAAFREPDNSERCGRLQPLFRGKGGAGSEPRLYICQQHTCGRPLTSADDPVAAIRGL